MTIDHDAHLRIGMPLLQRSSEVFGEIVALEQEPLSPDFGRESRRDSSIVLGRCRRGRSPH